MHKAPYTISLDSINSNVLFHVAKWTPKLLRNRSFFLLRTLINILHGANNGFLMYGCIRASHRKLAAKLGISREWTCKLIKKLRAAGWIKTSAPRKPNGKFQEVTTYRAGGKLQKVLIAMLKSPQRLQTHTVNSMSQEFPNLSKEEVKETDKQTDRLFPKGFVEGLAQGVADKRDMNKTIRW